MLLLLLCFSGGRVTKKNLILLELNVGKKFAVQVCEKKVSRRKKFNQGESIREEKPLPKGKLSLLQVSWYFLGAVLVCERSVQAGKAPLFMVGK